jgi:hypothetical protein
MEVSIQQIIDDIELELAPVSDKYRKELRNHLDTARELLR